MSFNKLSNDQHEFIKYLYENDNGKPIPINSVPNGLTPNNSTLKSLFHQGFIELKFVGYRDCCFHIAPKGKTYYENSLEYEKQQKYQTDYDTDTLQTEKEANKISKNANKLSVIAIVVSALALVVAIIALCV